MFSCTMCGKCCQHVAALGLPNVDGVCIFYLPETKRCRIYKDRPIVCRIDEGYEAFFKGHITKEEFYALNEAACKKLQLTG